MGNVATTALTRDETAVTPSAKKYWLLPWCAAAVLVVGGSLWYGFGRGDGGMSRSDALAACGPFTSSPLPSVASIQPAVVGLGDAQSLSAAETSSGWRYCFLGGSGAITNSELHAPVGAIAGVREGGELYGNVLMLVHLGATTTSVVITTAWSRSVVLSRGRGFEVLRVPIAKWPPPNPPSNRAPVPMGLIMGFDRDGRVTSSQPFAWCGLALNVQPGSVC